MLVGFSQAYAAHMTPAKWQEAENANPFRWAPVSKARKATWQDMNLKGNSLQKASIVTEADIKMELSDSFTYLDMPDGSTWFAAINLDKQVISQNEYHTDYNIVGIEATIFNSNYEKVGYINSPIEAPEGFEKCTSLQLASCVTKKFFNVSDEYEIMVMANFKPADAYGAVPFTYVFSLKGENTPATLTSTLPGYYTVAVNNAKDKWSEDFFMEFFAGEEYTDTEMLYTFDIYSKASYSSPTATKINSFTVDMVYTMSDGENEMMPVVMNSKGNELYVTVAKYEKTFFEDPFNPMNEKLSEDNHYLIDLYKKGAYDSELKKVSTASIPVQAPESGYLMRSYCIGAFEGNKDITFDFTTDGTPAFIVSVVNTDNMENTLSSFEVYSPEGTLLKKFGEGHQGFLRLSPINGEPEQYCFLMPNGTGENDLEYAFYDYPSMEKKAAIAPVHPYEGYDLILSLSLDRVPDGDSYNYAIAATGGISNEQNNTSHPVLWFDKDGNKLRVDLLNAGKNINRINPYISANGLDPYMMNTDDAREYMLFAQRRESSDASMSHTELMIVNNRDEVLLQYPFRSTDSRINVAIVNETSNPAIWISYETFDDKSNHNEFIKLPLNKFEGAGTKENPYLIRTQGDFEQIAYNLNGHYRIANDIDYRGGEFKPIKGQFTGSIDGDGHMVKNFKLDGGAMFSIIGAAGKTQKSFVKDLTLRGVSVENAPAILADASYATAFENVRIVNAEVEGEDTQDFGTLVNNAGVGSTIENCAVKAEINLPETDEVGGVVYTLGNDSKIAATSFSGKIKAKSAVGGIASSDLGTGAISDCHVTAEISAGHTVGGIIASSSRSVISRCVVEGELTADSPRMEWSDYAGGMVKRINVGGIAGVLQAITVEYDDQGNPKEPDPTLPVVISKCLVALDAINIPTDDPKLLETAHRVVGRSAINNDPQYLGEDDDYNIIWGEPAEAEKKIADNYVLDNLGVINPQVADALDSTEGKSLAYDELDREFFEGLGYGFLSNSVEAPWTMRQNNIPALWFEAAVGQYLEFIPGSISAEAGKTVEVCLHLEDVDVESLTIESSDESKCYANPVDYVDGGIMVEVTVSEAGSYLITASNGNVSAVLKVTGTSGVGSVEATQVMSYDGSTVRADGCALTLYNLQGAAVAAGRDAIDVTTLGGGVYVAVATAADGSRHTLKINVR